MMKYKIKLIVILIICTLLLIGCDKKEIKSSEVLDLVQSNYESIEFRDKRIEKGSKEQYLIDDFILKLGGYTLKEYSGELTEDYKDKVSATYKDGSKIILIDNKYLTINDKSYEIIDGYIDLDKFYKFIDN